MKFSFAPGLAVATVAAVLATLSCAAQATHSDAPSRSQNTQHNGQVIFSRSTDASGQTTTQAGPAAVQPGAHPATAPAVEDADRQAVTFTDLDLDVRLHTAAHQIAVRALLTVRNDGKTPLTRIPLQISSSLNWERIRVAGHDVSFPVATLNSDADHTGQLHEAAVPLAQPLAPGATLPLDVTYSGDIVSSAQRLLAVGTPSDLALRSDWDEISTPFTGLRGFGNVIWYPVSSVPVILGDGARLFNEIGEHKLRLTGARFRLQLTVEFPYGEQPTIALVNGYPVPLKIASPGRFDPEVDGIATAAPPVATLNFQAPSLFVAIRKAHTDPNLTAWTTPDNEVNVQAWTTAATTVAPFLEDWLGQHPRSQLTLLDLPDPDDTPYETGSLLAASLHELPADRLNGLLVHALTHAYTGTAAQSGPAWLSEGLATFMNSLWVEKQHGREQALGMLEADRLALALAEPSSPGEGPGQPLDRAISPVYYRTKAAYVLWMLRELIGDSALSTALRAYDAEPGAPGTATFEQLLKSAAPDRDFSWFFADWINADMGLPDLSIDSVYPNAAEAGNFLVAVNLSNTGYATAEVPLTVRSALTSITERVLIPARGKLVKRILIQGRPTLVQLNDGTVPETQASVHITHLDSPAAAATPGAQLPTAPQ
jgi:hypothetical protein